MIEGNETNIERQGYGIGHLFLAFVGGAAVGAATALLLAPQDGARSRSWVRDLFNLSRDRAGKVPKAFQDAADAAKEAFIAAIGEGKGDGKAVAPH